MLSEEGKLQLIKRCLNVLEKIRQKEFNVPLFVFSDSARFLNIAAEKGFHVLSSDNIGHPDYIKNNDGVYDKIFMDFYAMSKSQHVYKINDDYLYASVFSLYASIVGNVPFTTINTRNS